MPLFLILYIFFHRSVLRRVHFTWGNFCVGVAWWCGRGVALRLVLELH
jgi:hypothetical protein